MAVEERDKHTGYLTTGHEWDGLKELNRPVPRAIWVTLLIAFLFSLLWWVLMPAWPLVNSYTSGVLGIDQRTTVERKIRNAQEARSGWIDRVETLSYDEIRQSPEMMRFAMATATTLFGDNCAACHGTDGAGGEGFPSLRDNAWLWDNDDAAIEETLRVGINSNHPDTRISEMLAFGRSEILTREEIKDVAAYVASLSRGFSTEDADAVDAGKVLYSDNCESCHGLEGQGDTELGAPNLADDNWIYGGDSSTIFNSIFYGRLGHMPHWESRLTPAERKMLTLYVVELGVEKK